MRSELILIILLAVACSPAKKADEKVLHIVTSHVFESNGEQKVKDSVTVFDADYLEVDLNSYRRDSLHWFEGKKETGNGLDFFKIADQSGALIKFQNSTEFLNYLSGYGYEMVKEEQKSRYVTSFTFKKKG